MVVLIVNLLLAGQFIMVDLKLKKPMAVMEMLLQTVLNMKQKKMEHLIVEDARK